MRKQLSLSDFQLEGEMFPTVRLYNAKHDNHDRRTSTPGRAKSSGGDRYFWRRWRWWKKLVAFLLFSRHDDCQPFGGGIQFPDGEPSADATYRYLQFTRKDASLFTRLKHHRGPGNGLTNVNTAVLARRLAPLGFSAHSIKRGSRNLAVTRPAACYRV